LVGFTPTPTLQGGNTALDSNANPKRDNTFNSEYRRQRSYSGLWLLPRRGDRRLVWNDSNGNGIQDPGEAGINGVNPDPDRYNRSWRRGHRPYDHQRQRRLSLHGSPRHVHGDGRCQQLRGCRGSGRLHPDADPTRRRSHPRQQPEPERNHAFDPQHGWQVIPQWTLATTRR